jgi:hypothetical protein
MVYLRIDALSQHDTNLYNSSNYTEIMQRKPVLTDCDVNMPTAIILIWMFRWSVCAHYISENSMAHVHI